ncbi:MAG: PrgI family protein [Bacilli bacterium]
MEVKINKEIRDYTESIFLGLSFRQCLFSILACVIAIGIYFLFIDKVGLEVTSWFCMIGAIPFATLGFVKYQGMKAEVIVKNAWRSFLLSQTQLVYKPQNLYYEFLTKNIEQRRKEMIKPNDKKLRKNKKAE